MTNAKETTTATETNIYYKSVLIEEKARLKYQLRRAIEKNDVAFIYHHCLFAHPKYQRAARNLFLCGQGQSIVDDSYVNWVLRYYRRLTGKHLFVDVKTPAEIINNDK